MSDDSERIPTICSECGNEGEYEIGWLRARAGRRDFMCGECQRPANYTTEQLERVALNKRAGIFSKLRIN